MDTIAEAEAALRAARFDIVLAGEITSDGCGYDLTDSVVDRSATLLIAIALSETCLWLPVVQLGTGTLGDGALNSSTLQSEITALLNEKSAATEAPLAIAVHGFTTEMAYQRPILTQCRQGSPGSG